jgi:8-oxo-dGTP pyrophosphatase MutT (NUDIX family)
VKTLEDTIRRRLETPLPGKEAHLRFAPKPLLKKWDPSARPAEARVAAALILIYPGEQGPTVALTLRRSDLPHHPGQISFPGGSLDEGESPESGALREAHEEIGIEPSLVRVVGSLSSLWVIVSGFVVHPIIGVMDTSPVFVPSAREVETIIEVPVATLRESVCVKVGQRDRGGVMVSYPYFAIGDHHVWGATAMMLGEFCTALDPEFAAALR